jgi:hypothetical protein
MGTSKKQATLTLEAMNLVEMCKHHTFENIARRYGVSTTIVHRIASEQFNKLEVNKFESTPLKVKFEGLKGAWMDSQQRKDYQLIINNK